MKPHTLIFLLFCLNVSGQDHKPSVTIPIMNYDTLKDDHFDDGFYKSNPRDALLTPQDVLNLRPEYETECGQDTIWADKDVFNGLNLSETYDVVLIDIEQGIYYLVKKPTLDGFIEFLRKKYNL